MRAAACRQFLSEIVERGDFDRLFPEVAMLRGVPQPERYHREGDAFEHTLLALDSVPDDADERVFWGTLLHDIGKSSSTRPSGSTFTSHGHDVAGAALVPAVMARIGRAELADDVTWLVRNHLFHFSWNLREQEPLSRRQRRFTEHPLFPYLLEVCLADAAGSIGGDNKRRSIEVIRQKWFQEQGR